MITFFFLISGYNARDRFYGNLVLSVERQTLDIHVSKCAQSNTPKCQTSNEHLDWLMAHQYSQRAETDASRLTPTVTRNRRVFFNILVLKK